MDINKETLQDDVEETEEDLQRAYDAAARKLNELGEEVRDRTTQAYQDAEAGAHDLRRGLSDEDPY